MTDIDCMVIYDESGFSSGAGFCFDINSGVDIELNKKQENNPSVASIDTNSPRPIHPSTG